jgi:uncharacterized phage protein (TIGR01671 family)
MRDILFRAKDHLKGRWQYGAFGKRNDHATIYIGNGLKFPVQGDTVGQYTGLEDTAGRPIFEGDVIAKINKDGGINPGKTVFFKGAFYWDAINPDWDCRQLLSRIIEVRTETEGRFEIIGNIHDNPELTEGF